MPWCPVCKNEYKEGYKTCADCGAPLVKNFEDIEKVVVDEHRKDGIVDSLAYAANTEISGLEDNYALADLLEGKKDIFNQEEMTEDIKKITKHEKGYKPFMKASDRAAEYKSSAQALLFVGVIGIIFLFLCLCNIITINIAANVRGVGFVAMLIMFVAFIYVGIKSMIEAKTIDALSDAEEQLTDNITEFFKNYNKDSIDKLALTDEDMSLNEEMKYFKREEVIRNLIIEKFGHLDVAYVDSESERIFNIIYGN